MAENVSAGIVNLHTRTVIRQKSGPEENYCRNPDGADTAWCYTTDSDVRFELCTVPTCGNSGGGGDSECGTESEGQADYRGTIAKTKGLK